MELIGDVIFRLYFADCAALSRREPSYKDEVGNNCTSGLLYPRPECRLVLPDSAGNRRRLHGVLPMARNLKH